MATMVVKTDGVIAAPIAAQVLTGTVVTSDTFSGGDGDLISRMTDSKLGGVSIPWVGFQGFNPAGVYEIKGGIAIGTSGPSTTGSGTVGPNVRLSNLAIQFKLARLDVGLPVDNQFVDLRKVTDGTTTTYRLSFNSDGSIGLMYRSPTSPQAVIQTTGASGVKVGDMVLYIAFGNSHKVFVNGVLKIDVVHNGYLGDGLMALSRGGLPDPNTSWGIDDLIIYSLD